VEGIVPCYLRDGIHPVGVHEFLSPKLESASRKGYHLGVQKHPKPAQIPFIVIIIMESTLSLTTLLI